MIEIERSLRKAFAHSADTVQYIPYVSDCEQELCVCVYSVVCLFVVVFPPIFLGSLSFHFISFKFEIELILFQCQIDSNQLCNSLFAVLILHSSVTSSEKKRIIHGKARDLRECERVSERVSTRTHIILRSN